MAPVKLESDVNGTSIFYSGLRDFVATITGRGPWGSPLLPTVSFVDLEPEGPETSEHEGEAPRSIAQRVTPPLVWRSCGGAPDV